MKQSLERHNCLISRADKVYARHIREKTQPTEEELLGLLRWFTVRIPGTFYFLDALDEAPIDIQRELVDKLASVNARVFITSRPMDVQVDFPKAHHFEIAARDQDLDLHISLKLQKTGVRLRKLLDEGDGSLKVYVISVIKSKCGGM